MDLTLTGDIAKQIITLTKKDTKLAQALARQFLTSIEPVAMARFLLTADVATTLLADRIAKNPEQTLRQLQGLASRPGRTAGRAAGGAATRTGRRRRRHRLTSDEIQRIKSEVRTFLGRHPWSNRKQIGQAVTFPSLAAYNRIMAELRQEGAITAHGQKSKTVYAVKGAAGKAARATTAKPGKRTKKAAKPE